MDQVRFSVALITEYWRTVLCAAERRVLGKGEFVQTNQKNNVWVTGVVEDCWGEAREAAEVGFVRSFQKLPWSLAVHCMAVGRTSVVEDQAKECLSHLQLRTRSCVPW